MQSFCACMYVCVCVCVWRVGGGGGGGKRGWANKTSPGCRRQEECETECKQTSWKRADPSWRLRRTHTHTHAHTRTRTRTHTHTQCRMTHRWQDRRLQWRCHSDSRVDFHPEWARKNSHPTTSQLGGRCGCWKHRHTADSKTAAFMKMDCDPYTSLDGNLLLPKYQLWQKFTVDQISALTEIYCYPNTISDINLRLIKY